MRIMDDVARTWHFLSNHAHVLLSLSANADLTVRELSQRVGITERAVMRIISELAACGCALRWEEMCNELWPDGGQSPDQLRHRLDMALLRMRKRLKASHIREDLVQAAGTGMLELVLRREDTLVNET